MFEDAVLHPVALVVFCWLMLAEPQGYAPDSHLQDILLRMIYEMTGLQHKDYRSSTYQRLLAEVKEDEEGADGSLLPECSLLVCCIRCRRHYGGMACDGRMLLILSKLWTLRFSSVDKIKSSSLGDKSGMLAKLLSPPHLTSSSSVPMMDYVCAQKINVYMSSSNPWCQWLMMQIPPYDVAKISAISQTSHLRREDIPLSAIDFHVSGVIEELLQRVSQKCLLEAVFLG